MKTFSPTHLNPDVAQQTFSVKDKAVNIFYFVGHVICFATTQLCHCYVKASTDNMSTNGQGCISINLYLQKKTIGQQDL